MGVYSTKLHLHSSLALWPVFSRKFRTSLEKIYILISSSKICTYLENISIFFYFTVKIHIYLETICSCQKIPQQLNRKDS